MRTLTESEDAAEDLDPSLGSTHPEPEAGEEQEPRRVGEEIAHFRVIAELGRGGMGVVYLADDLKLRRRVALKVLRAAVASNPDRRRRFLREARTASAVMHPNVAAVFEVGEAGTELYLAMEHVDGRTLADVLADRGAPLEIPEVLRIAIAVARGIGRAHEAGIIHRDIKPANVMVGADGLVKILDFGVARLAEVPDRGALGAAATASVATVEGRILGTPGYMPPEQARGADVDVRTDMFAFGVMLYQLVTGKRPFRGASAIEVLVAVERDTPAPPSTLRAGVPAALDRLVMRCLEKRPEDRFTSFREISAALEGLSLDPVAPPVAAPAPRPSRGWLVALGVLVAIVAGGVWIARSRRTPAAPDPSAVALASSAAAPASSAVAPDPSAAAPASVASATASAAAASTVLARVCLEGDPGRTMCTDRNVVTWCDTSGRSMGCCGLGLVPMGADGICACAPGGTSVREAIARGCPAAPKDHAEAYKRVRDVAVNQAIDCFKPALSERRAGGGRFAADYFLTPQGEVFGARVNRSTVPDEKAQTCALDVLRATRFPAPRGEDAGKRLGFGFEFAP